MSWIKRATPGARRFFKLRRVEGWVGMEIHGEDLNRIFVTFTVLRRDLERIDLTFPRNDWKRGMKELRKRVVMSDPKYATTYNRLKGAQGVKVNHYGEPEV